MTFAALNDSRHIGISVYNVVFPCALGMTVVNVVDYHPDVTFAVLSVLVVFCTTITLCLVFFPKVITNRPCFQGPLLLGLSPWSRVGEDPGNEVS